MRTIVWFRGRDLRISDHEPLRTAAAAGEVIPLFVLDAELAAPEEARRRPHRTQFLLESLRELQSNLVARGTALIVVAGNSLELVPRLAAAWRADRVVAHRSTEPEGRVRDRVVAAALGDKLQLTEGETLFPPGVLRTLANTPYAVFSQFARSFRRSATIAKPLTSPRVLQPLPRDARTRSAAIPSCDTLGIVHNPAVLTGGERAARRRLRQFARAAVNGYADGRDRLDLPGTSRLSADLHFGTVSVRQVWTEIEAVAHGTGGGEVFCNELIWREFAHSTLWDRPELLTEPFRPAFRGFPWQDDAAAWQAWAGGQTGYPLVDASARQLLGEGFVHNRARMIAASFLTKHLLIDYRRGEAHYLRFLTDADPANNNMGWQWSAGCGCDAQPYFRIFNPVSQGERFDPEGDYVRRWVPELAELPARFIHRPWQAPEGVLRDAGVRLGRSYPRPIVEHGFARARFLAVATQHLRRSRTDSRRPANDVRELPTHPPHQPNQRG